MNAIDSFNAVARSFQTHSLRVVVVDHFNRRAYVGQVVEVAVSAGVVTIETTDARTGQTTRTYCNEHCDYTITHAKEIA